jgi:5-methylcytosine-specific restriction endonuclease McrA
MPKTRSIPYTESTYWWDVRQLIWAMSNGQCFYCGRELTQKTFVVDHVDGMAVPQNVWTNLVVACRYCNSSKGIRHVDDFLARKYPQAALFGVKMDDITGLKPTAPTSPGDTP